MTDSAGSLVNDYEPTNDGGKYALLTECDGILNGDANTFTGDGSGPTHVAVTRLIRFCPADPCAGNCESVGSRRKARA